jgi:hypothetical protein
MSTIGPSPVPFPGMSPDVCKAPAPASGPTPVPYPNMPLQTQWETTNQIRRVELQRKHGMTADKASVFTGTSGDEAGTAKALVSPKTQGKARHMMPAQSVKFEGKPAVRMNDVRARF